MKKGLVLRVFNAGLMLNLGGLQEESLHRDQRAAGGRSPEVFATVDAVSAVHKVEWISYEWAWECLLMLCW